MRRDRKRKRNERIEKDGRGGGVERKDRDTGKAEGEREFNECKSFFLHARRK